MLKITLAVLAIVMAAPAWAESMTLDQGEGPLMLEVPAEPVAPSADVPLYVPLTDAQQELPINEPDPGVDYVPGIEKPATPPAAKQITDQVPQ